MSYVFSDMEKSEIINAANICKGMRLRSKQLQYDALKLAGQAAPPVPKAVRYYWRKNF
ncbi:hypothetical protein LJJ44_03215 [Pseudomonas sp. B24_DOA]|nr:hypothetical protein LJJ44_03215 [Pseudomonas sp. B24_DOA]